MLAIGTEAPDFTTYDEEGNTVTLSSYREKNPVVLIFYPGDQTPICTRQLCSVRDDYDVFTEAGIVVFGVNNAGATSHRQFGKKHQFPFRLLIDEHRTISQQYDALLLNIGFFAVINRTVYGIGTDGTIVFAERGTPSNETIIAAIQ